MRTRSGSSMQAWFLGALLLFAGCGSRHNDKGAIEFNHIRWATFPVELAAESAILGNDDERADLRAAIDFWERHAGKRLFHISGAWSGPDLPYSGPADDPDSIRANALLFGPGSSLEPGVAGMTSLRVSDDIITGAVILVDPGTRFCTGACPGNYAATSLRRLLAHELGHFLGLGHSADPRNVMYPTIRAGATLRDRTVDEETLHRLTL